MLILATLAASVLTASSPAWADGCEGNSCSGFTQDEYVAVEGAGYAELQVSVAWCCPVAQGAIDYETSDLTALSGQDYQRTSGTLTFTGHGGNVIRVPIIDDGLAEGEERFEVRLTDFKGSFVRRGRERAIVRLLDEAPQPPSNVSVTPGRSNQYIAGPQAGSPTRPRRPATTPSSESSVAGTQSGVANPSDPNQAGEADTREEAMPIAAKTVQKDNFLPMASLGALLLLVIAAAGFALKRRLGHKTT